MPTITILTGEGGDNGKPFSAQMPLATFVKLLTPARIEAFRWVRDNPGASVAELARGLDRGYARVHEDVGALMMLGLLAPVPLHRGARASLRVAAEPITATIAPGSMAQSSGLPA